MSERFSRTEPSPRFDDDGYLYLIGRKKEIIVTGGGEKIHPEVIEADLNGCPDVERAVILGRDHSASLAAVIRSKQPGDGGSEDRIRQYVAELNKRLTKVSIGKVIFTDIVFTRENGFLRPNLKLDRKQINAHFQPEIEEKPLVKTAAEGGR
jgi:long-subunit acyl-CoA synthetase (AMP-forming)